MSKNVDKYVAQGGEPEGFFSRWSQRKLQVNSKQPAGNQAAISTDINASIATFEDEKMSPELVQEQVVLCDKDMPDLDSLDEDSDYSCFLSPGVSEQLRKLALRKLFQGQSFKLCDGLDDYDEEFTSFEKLGDIVTADMRFQLQQEAEQKLHLASENDAIDGGVSDESAEVVMLEADNCDNVAFEAIDDPSLDETADMGRNGDSRSSIKEYKSGDNEDLS